jgi:hypothetical protein
MESNGVPDVTCQAYQSKDLACDAMGICEDCTFKGIHMESVCSAVPSFPSVRVGSHGQIKGEAAMVEEISTRGTCGILALASSLLMLWSCLDWCEYVDIAGNCFDTHCIFSYLTLLRSHHVWDVCHGRF